jgi:hypothetical protein
MFSIETDKNDSMQIKGSIDFLNSPNGLYRLTRFSSQDHRLLAIERGFFECIDHYRAFGKIR